MSLACILACLCENLAPDVHQSRRALPVDFSASDVLAPNSGSARAERPAPGIDVALHQDRGRSAEPAARGRRRVHPHAASRSCARRLRPTRPSQSSSTLPRKHIESVCLRARSFRAVSPRGAARRANRIAALAEYAPGASAAIGISRYRLAARRAGQGCRHARRARDRVSAAGGVPHQGPAGGYLGLAYGLPRGGFDVNLQLLMKLLGTSLATGLERVRLSVALASHRGAQCAGRAGGQRWTVGLRRRGQRRLFLAALAQRCSATTRPI